MFHFGLWVRQEISPKADPCLREGQQQVFRATFPGIRDSVRALIVRRMDALARKFHETHDKAVSDEIYRLSRELIKLNELWKFVVI